MSAQSHDRPPRGKLLAASPRRTRGCPGRCRPVTVHRPWIELLEPRVVLSPTIFTVSDPGSGTSGSGSSGTLPYVISQANANTNTAGSEIEFDSSVFSASSPQTITLAATLVLSETAGPEVIDGSAAGVTISGGGAVGVFEVDSGVTATLSGLTMSGGSTTGDGAGLENNGTVTLTACTISGNSAGGNGGGVDNTGTATLTDCTVSGNSAASGAGIAQEAASMITLSASTLTSNTATSSGGGIWIGNGGTVLITNSTIASNRAAFGGGGIDDAGGSLTVTSSTIANNNVEDGSPDSGGGLLTSVSTVLLSDTIVAGNSFGLTPFIVIDDIAGSAVVSSSSSYNLIGNGGSDGITNGQNGNIVLTSLVGLGLSALGNYGGPTQTIALLPGSPAKGAGTTETGVTTDQRGLPLDSPPDIGAFQAAPGLVVNTTLDGASVPAGDLSLRQAINLASTLGVAETITFDPAVFANAQTITLTEGVLELSSTSAPITIDGPGAGLLVISGDTGSRVFQVDAGVTASISGVAITGGSAGLYNLGGNLSLTGCTISGNTGVGISSTGTLSLMDCAISDNGSAAQVYVGGSATLDDCTITGSAGTGMGMYNRGTTTLNNCTISGSRATGFWNGINSTATLNNCTISDNYSGLTGGGIYNHAGTLILTECTISGNSASVGGGGLYNSAVASSATLVDCTIADNSAKNFGGGLSNTDMLTLTGCTITGNSASDGAGMYNGGKATVTNCTISANSGSMGAGLENIGTATVTGCTISGNTSSDSGGGVYNKARGALDYGILNLADTIVAGNSGGDVDTISGSVSGSFDLIGTGGSGGIQGGEDGNIVLTSLSGLGLAPLGYYGGPTETMALLPGSPAIDAGDNALVPSGVTTDQRGYTRIADGTVDIGAFEVQSIPLVVNTTADGTACPPGELDLRAAINLANISNGAQTITFDPTVFATAQTITLTDGQLELSNTSGTETITGPAAGVTISGGGLSRVFQIDSGVTAVLSGLTITGGSTTGYGGGVYDDGTTTFEGVTISGNSADEGAGLFITKRSTSSLIGCTLSGNSARMGGGLYNGGGSTTLSGCTVSGNSADTGGGLFITKRSTSTLIGCTMSGNTASTGGGLYNSSTTNLYACTIGANSAATGGGIANATGGNATLEDTIVAANTGTGGAPSDIGGADSTAVVGTYNLVGTGGSGGIAGGTGDIVLTNPNIRVLGPLGNYGGPTQTMPLLPGSPAIGAGSAIAGVTTDERGASRPTSGAADIGAFEDHGYTVTVSSGSPQSTQVSQAFSSPLVAVLTENFAHAPVSGATIVFGAPSTGASATLSASSVVTDASGLASVTATANATYGTYTVTASIAGGTTSASFSLVNQIQPSFSGLSAQTVTYGSTVVLNGTLAAGSQVPVGETIAVTLDGITHEPKIASGGSFTTEFTGADVVLNASATAYVISYHYQSDGAFLAVSASSQLTVNPAVLTITAKSDTKVYDGSMASAATPTLSTLYNGDTVTGLTQAFTSKNAMGAGGSTLSVTGYAVHDGNGGKDYTVVTETATGTINPAPLQVRVTGASTVYGSSLPSLTYTIAGFVSGDSASAVSGAPVIATTATPRSSAGTYPITIASGTLSARNYIFPAADLIAGTLTVAKAPLVIAAMSTSMFAGGPIKSLTAVYTGFKNGDTPASLTSPPLLGTPAGPSSAPGEYPITAGGASSPNYTFTYVPGTLTVILAPAVVESVSVEKVKLSKRKTVQEIVLQFSEALDAASAESINSFSLATVPKNKKQKSKPVALAQATYNPAAFTVMLRTRKTLVLNPPLDLTVKAASLLDSLGRELDGDKSGQPGGNFTAVVSKGGATVTSARALARIG